MRFRRPVVGWVFAVLVGCSFAGAEEQPGPATPVAKEVKARIDTSSGPVPRDLRDAVASFYAERNYEPAWLDAQRRRTAAADELLASMCAAAEEGLDPASYPAEELRGRLEKLRQSNQDFALAAQTDLQLTATFFRYATHLRDGRISAKRARWHFEQEPLDLPEVLRNALSKNRVSETLQALVPRHPEYARLRKSLADLRALAARGGYEEIPAGPTLAVGAEHDRVVTLRRRLSVENGAPPVPPGDAARRFDEAVEQAVKTFQLRTGLTIDGKVGPSTRRALNLPIDHRIEQVVINMERLRWLPDELGEAYVLVNVPGFWLEARRHGKVVVRSPVIVGEDGWNTPVFTDHIDGIEVHPDWVATKKIAAADIVPILQRAPGWAAKKNMVVVERGSGREVDPRHVDWSSVNPDDYVFIQRPGPENPLGRAKFKMSNPYTIFLHGTPSHEAFDQPRRALSHGCIRVQEVDALARFVTESRGRLADWEAAHASGQKTPVDFESGTPVHIIYLTAWVDEQGVLQTRPDIYDRDASLRAMVKPDAQPTEPAVCS